MRRGRSKTGSYQAKGTSSRVEGPAQSLSALPGRLQPGAMQAYGWMSKSPTGPLLLVARLVALLLNRLRDREKNKSHAASAQCHRRRRCSSSNLTNTTNHFLLQSKTPSPTTHRPLIRHCSTSSRLVPDRVALLAACGRPRAPGALPRLPPSTSALAPPPPHTPPPSRQPMPPPHDTLQHHQPPLLLLAPADAAVPAARASSMVGAPVVPPLLRNRRGSGQSGREGRGALLAVGWRP